MENNRITVILGAGAMIDATNVSTYSISRKVFAAGKITGSKAKRLDAEEIAATKQKRFILKRMYLINTCKEYVWKWDAGKIAEKVNFEEYFNVLELMGSYLQGNFEHGAIKEYVSPHHVFTKLMWEIRELDCEVGEYEDSVNFLVQRLLREAIMIINDTVHDYDILFQTKGKSFKNFFETLEDRLACRLDVFNLNYDTWMEQALPNYNDGYVSEPGYDGFKRFSPTEYLKEDDRNRLSSMHGQIYFDELSHTRDESFEEINRHVFEDTQHVLYKYKDYEKVRESRRFTFCSSIRTQEREQIYRTNIVTGLMKADKILRNPFAVHQMKLFDCLLHNKKLVIIGYGFGDFYLNSMLETFLWLHIHDKKILVVDKMDKDYWDSRYRMVMEQGSLSESDKIVFLAKAFKSDTWRQRGFEEFMYSDDGSSCFFTSGFKKLCAKKRLLEVVKFMK